MNRSVLAIALGFTFSLLSATSFAIGLEQKGNPDTQPSSMPSYGMEVSSRTALKSLLPAGWQLFVHQSVKLPETLSWKIGDTWTAVLAEFATNNSLSILVDWDTKMVLVRTDEVAVQERATRAEIAQAASTPLPRFNDAVSPKDEQRLAAAKNSLPTPTVPKEAVASALKPTEPAPAVSLPTTMVAVASTVPSSIISSKTTATTAMVPKEAELMHAASSSPIQVNAQTLSKAEQKPTEEDASLPAKSLPVIRTNPTPLMVAEQKEAAVKNPPKLASTTEFSYTQPVALNKPAARKVAQAIAHRYNLRLVWAAPEVDLQGPVTLLAQSAQEDTALLDKALGVYSPVVFEVSLNEKVLRVLPRELAGTKRTVQQAQAVPVTSVATSAQAPASQVEILKESNLSQPQSEQAQAKADLAPKMTLSLHEKEPLEDALVRFARAQGYTLEWNVAGGFEANREMTFEGNTIVQILSQLLPPLGISADVYTRDKHIIVRPGESRDR